MNDVNNQTNYWNSVAAVKTFTHPANLQLLNNYIHPTSNILDYGCGYGRITAELFNAGYTNILGVDTSAALVKRGKQTHPELRLQQIENLYALPVQDNSLDAVLLFAVLTCIPSNKGQQELITALHTRLKPGGIIYTSDYYLQDSKAEVSSYKYYKNDPENYGVFTLREGAIFRHHTKEWIQKLLAGFSIVHESLIEVKTMNGYAANAFQQIAVKN